jgi:hypothetical protein
MDDTVNVEERFREVLKAIGRDKKLPKIEDDTTEEVEIDEGDEGKEADEKPLPAPTAINLFQHPDTHPIVLDLALLRKYGPEWLQWEAETVEWRVPQDFKASGVSDLNMNKVNALKTLHMVETYWNRWEVFNWCTSPLNGLFPDFEVLQVPTLAQCLVSIDIASRVRTDVAWSEEVKGFLEVVYRHDGVFCPLPPADFVSIDSEGLPVDCEEVQKLWPSVKESGQAPTEETVTAEQLRRALSIHNYLEENRDLLRQQLPLVLNA